MFLEGVFQKHFLTKTFIIFYFNLFFQFQFELDVTVCKTYSYMMKAMKSEPYFVATHEGKFSSKCDEALANALSSTAVTAKTTTKTTSTSTTASEASEEPTLPSSSSTESKSTTSEATSESEPEHKDEETMTTQNETTAQEENTSMEDKKTTESVDSPPTTTGAEEGDKKTTAAEGEENDNGTTTQTETTKSDASTTNSETTMSEGGHDNSKDHSEGDFDQKNALDDPEESFRSHVDVEVDPNASTVPGETTVSTTMSAKENNSMAEIELNTSIITLTTGELDTDSTIQSRTDASAENIEGKVNMSLKELDENESHTTGEESMTTELHTTLGSMENETTHEMMTGRFDSVKKEKEVSRTFEEENDSSIESSMKKRGRILMGKESSEEAVESNRNADQARALQFNPWGKNSAQSHSLQQPIMFASILFLISAFFV